MPVKYVDEAGAFIDSQALKESGAPRAYGINTADDLISTSLSSDKKNFMLFRAKL